MSGRERIIAENPTSDLSQLKAEMERRFTVSLVQKMAETRLHLLMRRFLFLLVVMALSGVGFAQGIDRVRAAQERLQQEGFYFGNKSGVYDSETSAAVTRFQIRRGLPINGKLDEATAKALGVPVAKANDGEAVASSGTWRQMRNGDMQFLKKLNAGEIPPPAAPSRPAASVAPRKNVATTTAARAATPATRTQRSPFGTSPERLSDYVGAFVLAGLDPQVGSELEFFAEKVDYFGERNVARSRIGRDLIRYAERWPDRTFSLAGELKIERTADQRVKVTFPLRYDLHNGRKHAAGEVWKTLTLRKAGADDYEIVAVNERKKR